MRIRETKLEEEEQLRLLMECEGTMAAECDSDKELEGPFSSKEKAEQIAVSGCSLCGVSERREVGVHTLNVVQTFL